MKCKKIIRLILLYLTHFCTQKWRLTAHLGKLSSLTLVVRHDLLMIQHAPARNINHNTLTLTPFHQHWPKNVSSRTLDMHMGIIKEKKDKNKIAADWGLWFQQCDLSQKSPISWSTESAQEEARKAGRVQVEGRRMWRRGSGTVLLLNFFPVISSTLHRCCFFQKTNHHCGLHCLLVQILDRESNQEWTHPDLILAAWSVMCVIIFSQDHKLIV